MERHRERKKRERKGVRVGTGGFKTGGVVSSWFPGRVWANEATRGWRKEKERKRERKKERKRERKREKRETGILSSLVWPTPLTSGISVMHIVL